MDVTMASFFYENRISFNVLDSLSFSRMIDVSMRFTKILFKVIKLHLAKNVWGPHQAHESTEQMPAPNLAAATKHVSTVASHGLRDGATQSAGLF